MVMEAVCIAVNKRDEKDAKDAERKRQVEEARKALAAQFAK